MTGIAVVGLGPRGLSVLERVMTLAARSTGEFDVHLIDSAPHGTGVHDLGQPDYLLLNTVCGELTMFPPPGPGQSVLSGPHPNLHEWVVGRDLLVDDDGYTVGNRGRDVGEQDFLPRRLLGEYLRWFHGRLLAEAPGNVRVHSHHEAALDVKPVRGGFDVVLESAALEVDAVFLTTGHSRERPGPSDPRVVDSPYPLPERLGMVRGSHTFACAGFGLTAIDVVCALTLGRGGKFTDDGGVRRYLPSGDEPRIVMYSRSGLPYRARPASGRTRPGPRTSVFTGEAVAALREKGPIGLREDLLPLVYEEMALAHESTRLGLGSDGTGFDAAQALSPQLPEFLDSDHYRMWLSGRIASDLREAYAGLEGSPLKAAMEVLREQRDVIREAVDFGGLDRASTVDFYSWFAPLANRNVTGPQADRHRDLLALMEAGVVEAPLGPAPRLSLGGGAKAVLESTRLRRPCRREVEWVCRANVVFPSAERSAEPLLRALHERGTLQQRVPGSSAVRGVAVAPSGNPIGPDGGIVERLWVWGPLAEGSTFYNHYVPSPGPRNRAFRDAHRYVSDLFAQLR